MLKKYILSILSLFFSTSLLAGPPQITLENLVDEIHHSLTVGARPDGDPLSSSKATSISICQPGIPIDPEKFKEVYSFSNPNGDIGLLESFSNMVNAISDQGTYAYAPTSSTVTGSYGLLVNSAQSSAPDPTPEEKARYEQARDVLFVKKPPLVPGGNELTVESDAFLDYLAKKAKYENSVYVLNLMRLTYDLSKPEDQRRWMVEAAKQQGEIDTNWRAWNAAYKTDIEAQLAIMGSTMTNGIATEIARVRQVFETSATPSLSQVPGAAPWRPVYTFPENWFLPEAQGWTEMVITEKSAEEITERHTKSFSGSAGFSVGLWSFGGKGGYSKDHRKETKESSNLKISMELAVVQLQRPWLLTDWMKSSQWHIPGEEAGRVSSGAYTTNVNDMIFPSFPNRIVVARNVKMTADWSQETSDELKTKISSGASFGWGPFKIGGSYEQGDETKKVTSTFDGTTLTINGMQIIAFGNTALPYAAPKAGPQAE